MTAILALGIFACFAISSGMSVALLIAAIEGGINWQIAVAAVCASLTVPATFVFAGLAAWIAYIRDHPETTLERRKPT